MTDEITIPEKQIKYIKATAIPKPGDDQNTERIVPGRFLKETSFENMGEYAFFDERYLDGDANQPVEGHPFNDPRYDRARILVVDGNGFGSGSSREHAVQAIQRYGAGMQAILAGSFAEIFAKNCQNIGLVCATADPDSLAEWTDTILKNPSTIIAVDLEHMTAGIAEEGNPDLPYALKAKAPIFIPEGRKKAFLTGTWDFMGVVGKLEDKIAEKERTLPYLAYR